MSARAFGLSKWQCNPYNATDTQHMHIRHLSSYAIVQCKKFCLENIPILSSSSLTCFCVKYSLAVVSALKGCPSQANTQDLLRQEGGLGYLGVLSN